MTVAPASSTSVIAAGSDCTAAFRAAYENRYTWDPGFGGYSGSCSWEQGDQRAEGSFQVGADLKAQVEGIADEAIHKAMASQLWEVAIHRVRRSFEQTHGENTFTAGETDAVGTEVIVGGETTTVVRPAASPAPLELLAIEAARGLRLLAAGDRAP
ncbi:MAG: DUF3386 family protein, partial [Betaproteobacteria bacterium]|nr:DUF3386 family protein [Betaproteobacteria bacterium]